MRIISGKYKGRRIEVSKRLKARPTTDFAKENLFNVLSNTIDFEGLHVLDLFSGTGSIAFEFISRGCARVDCVELNQEQIKFIHKTAASLEIDNLHTHRYPAEKYIKNAVASYDIIFADPPYEMKGVANLPEQIMASNLLKKEGILIFEHGSKQQFNFVAGYKEIRKYGSVHLSFFKK